MAEYADAGNNNMENKNVGGRPPTPKAAQSYYMSVSTGCSLAGLLSMHVTLWGELAALSRMASHT